MIINKIFEKCRTIGVVGNPGVGKSMLVLTELLELKKQYPDVPIYVLGVEESLKPYLESKGIKIIISKMDLLDMKINNSILYIDEFASIFNLRTRTKEFDKVIRFFNRIEHLNNYVIISSAEQSFWTKQLCGLIRAFLVKEIELGALINGSTLKERIKAIECRSDYRLEMGKNEFYVLNEDLTEKHSFGYNPSLDSKKDLKNPFLKTSSKTSKKNLF